MRRVLAVVTTALVGVLFVGQLPAMGDVESVRPARRGAVRLHLATSTSVRGCEEVTIGLHTMCLIPLATPAGGKVTSAEAVATRGGSDVELTLTDDGAEWFGTAIDRHGADHLVIFVGRKTVGAGELSFDAAEGSVKITGLSVEQAEQLVRVLNRPSPAGATFTAVADRTTIQPGETATLDVFLSGASNVRTYQVTLVVSGGSSGQLNFDNLSIDTERSDYVFGTLEDLHAVDQTGHRMGAVLMQGSVEAINPAYVGSYTMRASSDASGVFEVNVRLDDDASILWNSDQRPIPFSAGQAVAISVGTPTRLRPIGK